MSCKEMTLKKYIEITKPKYCYLKLTADKSIRNNNSSNIAKAISYMYVQIKKRIIKEEKKYFIHTDIKCAYFIDIYKNNVNFYFIVPEQYKTLAIEKIRETWPKCTIEEVEGINPFNTSSTKYSLSTTKLDALSINVDKTSNEPLNSILNVMDIMKDGDRIGIMYNFKHYSSYIWNNEYAKCMKKINKKEVIDKEINSMYFLKICASVLTGLLEIGLELLSDLFGGKKSNENNLGFIEAVTDLISTNKSSLSNNTKNKKDSIVLNTQIVIASESPDIVRQNNNAVAVCQSYKTLDEDNSINYYKLKNKNIDFEKQTISNAKSCRFSVNECTNFLQLPGRTLLETHNISHINTFETDVPEQIINGSKLIGLSIYKGKTSKVYLSSDKDYKNLALVVVGPTRSGKTSFLGNIARNSIDNDECVIVLDYIENCGLSEDIAKCIPQDKIFEVDLSDYKNLQGLGYNEAIKEANDPFKLYESAKQQTSQVIQLINSINVEGSEFTPKMKRYLEASCLVVFVNNGAIRDVLSVLQNEKIRNQFILKIPSCLKEYLNEYVIYLEELDEYSKSTKDNPSEIVGTKTNNIVGILDRFSELKSNTYMEFMLKKGIENNFNLYEEMEKNQCIFLKMPEFMFSTPQERDVMATYWLTKIWMSGQVRAMNIPDRYKRKTVTVITDEIAQLENAEKYIGSKLSQTAKFGIKFVISAMYLNELRIREKLRTANTSYIFIAGADKLNYKEMKEEFVEKGFELDDMMKLKRYHSLNYIKYEDGYWAGITELPKPISL